MLFSKGMPTMLVAVELKILTLLQGVIHEASRFVRGCYIICNIAVPHPTAIAGGFRGISAKYGL